MPTVAKFADTFAEVVNTQFFLDGVMDPSAEEIAEEYYGELLIGEEVVQGIAARMKQIREVLEENYDFAIVTVNKLYYKKYRQDGPQTSADAKRCLPIGAGVKAWGIRRIENPNDLIYQEYLLWSAKAASGWPKKVLHRMNREVDQGRLTVDQARDMIQDRIKIVSTNEKKFYRKLLEQFPD